MAAAGSREDVTEERHAEAPPAPSFDDYDLLRPLGAGGMGRVWLGHDRALDRPVAIKFIAPDHPTAHRERFLREARALARLSHPNVVSVYRIGEVRGVPYIAYEFVSGQSLDRLARPLPWSTALSLAVGLARGLEAAHASGILHRDIKPGNAVLSDRGVVKLLDFGLAKLSLDLPPVSGPRSTPSSTFPTAIGPGAPAFVRASLPSDPHATTVIMGDESLAAFSEGAELTQPGKVMGTPAYMAPELWRGEAATVRTDLFALGLLVFELLVGRLPHVQGTWLEIGRAVTCRDLPSLKDSRPDVPDIFALAIDRCARRDPEARPESVSELRETLEEARRVFVPIARAGLDVVQLEPERVALGASLARLRGRMDELTHAVYERVFRYEPEVRELFPSDLGPQRAKLSHALELAVAGLTDPERLVPRLEELGRRHRGFGVKPEHFAPFERAVLESIAELEGPRWGEALHLAWRRGFALVESAMRRGMSRESDTAPEGWPRSATPAAATPQSEGPWPAPETRYARRGDVSLAFQTFGDGPHDLVVLPGWLSHAELLWAHPLPARFLSRLGKMGRVILVDERGWGLSDRPGTPCSPEDRVDDLLAVMAAARAHRPVIVALDEGVNTALTLAALDPSHVGGLVLHAPRCCAAGAHDAAWGAPHGGLQDALRRIDERWGQAIHGTDEAPSLADDAEFQAWRGRLIRSASSPGAAAAQLRTFAEVDLRPLLGLVAAPTLILHAAGDRVIATAGPRRLADTIPGARLLQLRGSDHLAYAGDVSGWFRELRSFLDRLPTELPAARALEVVIAVDGGAAHSFTRAAEAIDAARAMLAFEPGIRLGIAAGPPGRDGERNACAMAQALAARAPAGQGLADEAVRQLSLPILPALRNSGDPGVYVV